MALYTREAFEKHSKLVEDIRAEATRALLRKAIDGFEKRKIDTNCDDTLEKLKGKLAATRMILSDKEAMRKSLRFVFIIPRKNKPYLWRRATTQFTEMPAELSKGCWMDTNDEGREVWTPSPAFKNWCDAESCTPIWLTGRGAKRPSALMTEIEEDYVVGYEWEPCTLAQAQEYSQAGNWSLDKEGKRVFDAHYMVRFNELTNGVRYGEYIDIRPAEVELAEGAHA